MTIAVHFHNAAAFGEVPLGLGLRKDDGPQNRVARRYVETPTGSQRMSYLITYVVTLVAMLAMDGVWLTLANKPVYRSAMGDLMLPHFNAAPAVVFYLLFPIGLMIFAILPAMKAGAFGSALLYGALLGAFAYMTYDLTNYATLRGWTLQLTLIDIGWGTFLCAATSAVAYLVAPMLGAKFGG